MEGRAAPEGALRRLLARLCQYVAGTGALRKGAESGISFGGKELGEIRREIRK
jgi:hypothetical protein